MIHSRQQAHKLFLTLLSLELLFIVVYATHAWVQGETQQVHSLIDLDAEGNLPAWFSSFQLALIAIGFWLLASRYRTTERPSRYFLRACAGFFLLLSIDESALLHERITESLGNRYIDWVPAYLVNHPGESLVCALILCACLAAACPQIIGLWRLSRRASLIAAAGCAIFVTGAAGLESLGYKLLSGATLQLYRVEVAAEEFLEMLGGSLILYAVSLFCMTRAKKPGHIG